jgi:hypothetical protein
LIASSTDLGTVALLLDGDKRHAKVTVSIQLFITIVKQFARFCRHVERKTATAALPGRVYLDQFCTISPRCEPSLDFSPGIESLLAQLNRTPRWGGDGAATVAPGLRP